MLKATQDKIEALKNTPKWAQETSNGGWYEIEPEQYRKSKTGAGYRRDSASIISEEDESSY